jgi:hypothetical protein
MATSGVDAVAELGLEALTQGPPPDPERLDRVVIGA